MIVGATSALFSKENQKALVFGLGTGVTAGSTARLYGRTKVVEINPAMSHIPKHFHSQNQNLMENKNADIVLEDGISTLLYEKQNYDAIISTFN